MQLKTIGFKPAHPCRTKDIVQRKIMMAVVGNVAEAVKAAVAVVIIGILDLQSVFNNWSRVKARPVFLLSKSFICYSFFMKKLVSNSLADTSRIAREWLSSLLKKEVKDKDSATVVGLSGHLGAGKTAFVKAVAAELGINEPVTSPTFVIMKLYETKSKQWKRLVHIDAYRLESARELEALNFEELVADQNNLIMVEWPENIELREIVECIPLGFKAEGGRHEISMG
jgi:tRNA threonylcarbamoyl adenosine modification protein YjeE